MTRRTLLSLLLPALMLVPTALPAFKRDTKPLPEPPRTSYIHTAPRTPPILPGDPTPLSAGRPVPLEGFTQETAEQVTRLFRNVCTFAVNTWYDEIKDYDAQPADRPIDFRKPSGDRQPRNNEQRYRPGAQMCRALATALVLNVYDEKICGRPKEEAVHIAVRLAESAAARYRMNQWGRGWQDALWAAEYALGAWLLRDRLSDRGWKDILSMVERECDSFLTRPIPYYRDASGRIRYRGDTKAEEIAWNTNVLNMGVLMMPDHPRRPRWERKLTEMFVAAYARPADLTSDRSVCGLRLRDTLKGSNINDDGTLVNHGRIHPDYMTSHMFSTNCLLSGAFAPHAPNLRDAAIFNADVLYRALVDLDIGKYNPAMAGKRFYSRTPDGKPAFPVNYPKGDDWGNARQINFALADTLAAVFGEDRGCSIRAVEWLKVRLPEMLRMQSRLPTFQYYQTDKEDRFYEREEYVAQHACMIYVALWMKREGLDGAARR